MFETPSRWFTVKFIVQFMWQTARWINVKKKKVYRVLMDLRNGVFSFALFTVVSDVKIGFRDTNKHSMLPWYQQRRNELN